MRHEIKETIEINRLEYCSCDICGNRCEDPFCNEAKAELNVHYYPIHKLDSIYDKLYLHIDICLTCLKEKILPLVKYKSTRSER